MEPIRTDRSATAQAAWRQLLEDADVKYFEFGDLGSNIPVEQVVAAGARTFENGTVEFGTMIVRRDECKKEKDRYVALQFHPPHTNLHGPQSKLWHFHAREARVVAPRPGEPVPDPRDLFEIADGAHRVAVYSHPNSEAVWTDEKGDEKRCLEHYFIDPTARRTARDGDNSKFVIQMRAFAKGIGSSKVSGDLDFNYTKVQQAMASLVRDFEWTFGRP